MMPANSCAKLYRDEEQELVSPSSLNNDIRADVAGRNTTAHSPTGNALVFKKPQITDSQQSFVSNKASSTAISTSAFCADFDKKNKFDRKSDAVVATVSIDSAEFVDRKDFAEKAQGQGNFCSGGSSNIYGAGRRGGISFLGSWALKTCKEEGIMPRQGDHSIGYMQEGGLGQAPPSASGRRTGPKPNASNNAEPESRRWYFQGGTMLEFRANHLLKVFAVMMVVMVVISVVFHSRIRHLENERAVLAQELSLIKISLDRLVERMEYVASKAIPSRSERMSRSVDEKGDEESGETSEKRSPRAASPTRTTKELLYSTSDSINLLNNGSSPFDSTMENWTTGRLSQTPKSPKGLRAAYLEIDGTSVNIRKSKQLIGPWYLPESGNDIGFNDMWYKNLALDSNGTQIIFQERGLFLIYAQIFYQQQPLHNVKPTPMGFRIHLRKNKNIHGPRTRTIAECVPSFPTTYYQTCFTQVAWFVEAEDLIYLEHFTDSKPMIEAVKNGQTFLGIVQLSN